MHENLTNHGKWYLNGNAVHMEFPGCYAVETVIEGNQMIGSWKNGQYKFTLVKVK